MTEQLTLEFEVEYCFTHKGITYQGYINPTQHEEAYQREIDTCIPGLQGEELAAVKLAFRNSLHFYPKKDQDKFQWPIYEYTLGDSATAAYKTLATKVVGFSTGSTSARPIPPKPQPTLQKPDNSKGDKEKHNNEQHPNTPPGNQEHDSKKKGPPGGGGPPGGEGGEGGEGLALRPPLIPQ